MMDQDFALSDCSFKLHQVLCVMVWQEMGLLYPNLGQRQLFLEEQSFLHSSEENQIHTSLIDCFFFYLKYVISSEKPFFFHLIHQALFTVTR